MQPSGNGDRVIMLYGDYQEMRTNEGNAKLALAVHQARGYGQLTGGWGYSSKPTALRAYSQVFGVEILGAPGRVDNGQELVKQWLKGALMTKGTSGLSFSRQCRKGYFRRSGDAGLQGARAGDGPPPFAGCAPVLLYRVGRSMTMSASEHSWGYKKRGKWSPLWAEQQHDCSLRLPK